MQEEQFELMDQSLLSVAANEKNAKGLYFAIM